MKFRAFDLDKKRMINHEELFGIDCSNEYPFLALLMGYCDTYMEPLRVDIMIYTGIQDKNEVAIYKKDIVKILINNVKGRSERIGEIIYEDGSFKILCPIKNVFQGITFYSPYSFFISSNSIESIEVIGNVHENPELLENIS